VVASLSRKVHVHTLSLTGVTNENKISCLLLASVSVEVDHVDVSLCILFDFIEYNIIYAS
jgi:hypothetical protein